jgi:hypothetical protein
VYSTNSSAAVLAESTNPAKGSHSNKSGLQGVYFHVTSGRWAAQIAIAGGEKKHVGLFDTAAEAAAGRQAFIEKLSANPVIKTLRSKSGFKGVYKHVTGRWEAQIRLNGRQKSVGVFDTPMQANEARLGYLAKLEAGATPASSELMQLAASATASFLMVNGADSAITLCDQMPDAALSEAL